MVVLLYQQLKGVVCVQFDTRRLFSQSFMVLLNFSVLSENLIWWASVVISQKVWKPVLLQYTAYASRMQTFKARVERVDFIMKLQTYYVGSSTCEREKYLNIHTSWNLMWLLFVCYKNHARHNIVLISLYYICGGDTTFFLGRGLGRGLSLSP